MMLSHLLGASAGVTASLSLMLSSGDFLSSRVFRPDPMPPKIEWKDISPPESIEVKTADGLLISGYRWKARCEPHVAMIFFHGNGGNRFTAADLAAPMRRDDVDLIVASYRGYGDNPGKPSEEGLYHDAAAFVRLARASNPSKLYLFGFSLGGAVALRSANELGADGVVTLGAFSSLRSVAPAVARGLLPYKFNNVAEVRRLQVPLLMIHGSADRMVPIAEAEKLKEAAGAHAGFVRLTGAPHNIALDQIAGRIWTEIAQMAASSRNAGPAPNIAGNPAHSATCKDIEESNMAD